ncbi:hypothetical protein EB241_03080 [Erwinia psidii]|uniref:Uncharacterized protein n=1 Tax=Erwinia psidii TaxID=69224 RepID=A0A3N6S1L1_9GAMM|nr:hypothetical protein EB241_03080 [Erwinia psidii]
MLKIRHSESKIVVVNRLVECKQSDNTGDSKAAWRIYARMFTQQSSGMYAHFRQAECIRHASVSQLCGNCFFICKWHHYFAKQFESATMSVSW